MDFGIYEIMYYVYSAIAVLIALTVHEYCHGYVAYKLGDDTARNFGRLTLNPIKHIDPFGAICMLLFRVGWAKPVPINARNFKNPKRDFALVALAGPAANLILGFFCAFFYLLALSSLIKNGGTTEFGANLLVNLTEFLGSFFAINIGLGLFNLLPIPPFDGSRLLNVILPPKTYFAVMKYERQIYFGVLAWLLLGDVVAQVLRMIPVIYHSPLLYDLVGVFALSDMLGWIINAVSNLIIDFWQLIPFLKI